MSESTSDMLKRQFLKPVAVGSFFALWAAAQFGTGSMINLFGSGIELPLFAVLGGVSVISTFVSALLKNFMFPHLAGEYWANLESISLELGSGAAINTFVIRSLANNSDQLGSLPFIFFLTMMVDSAAVMAYQTVVKPVF